MFVRSQKYQKIDLNCEYPCPCKRQGRLLPITLTEAFGCNRCQQIFVVEDNAQVIEQLSSSYPYKKAWRWTGHRWIFVNHKLKKNSISIFLFISTILLMILLSIILRSSLGISIILWAILVISLIIPSAFVIWWLYRR